VSYTKDGFLWGDVEARFLDKLRRVLDAAPLRLIHKPRNHVLHPDVRDLESRGEKAATSTSPQSANRTGGHRTEKGEPEPKDPRPRTGVASVPQESRSMFSVGGSVWRIAPRLSADESRMTGWRFRIQVRQLKKKGHIFVRKE